MELRPEFIEKYKYILPPMTELGMLVYYRSYSRYLENEGRREYWWETVKRAVEFNCSLDPNVTHEEAEQLYDNIFNLRQFLSGRTFMAGGTAVTEKSTMFNFNCSATKITKMEDFIELFYLLMLGSGVGVRIMKKDIEQLPELKTDIALINQPYTDLYSDGYRLEHTRFFINLKEKKATIMIGDSKEGWTEALRYYFLLFTKPKYENIKTVKLIYDFIRPKGTRLKTFGGTASGHINLQKMFEKIHQVICNSEKKWHKLLPIDCLDIATIIGENVVSGGVRRAAEITLIDSDDEACINAKNNLFQQIDGEWRINDKIIHRRVSNNSIMYQTKPSREQLHQHMEKIRFSGEPGFVNVKEATRRREDFECVNPCAEILLANKGMCNLTTVNVMAFVKNGELLYDALLEAQRLSVRAGLRMTLVDLELAEWDFIQKRDRLLGCSMTGYQDMVNASGLSWEDQKILLNDLWSIAIRTAEWYARDLDIIDPKLVTTIKPEGTLSQLPTVSSGLHFAHAPYYIRRIRIWATDPIVKACEEMGYPIYPEVGQTEENCMTKVLEFPCKSPEGRTKYDVSAIEQLKIYQMFMEYYVDHNASITVHVREHEWDEVEQWVWDNWDTIVGISFLSLDDNFYELAPYEAITKEEYEKRLSEMQPFNPDLITKYEHFDSVIEQQIDT